jgi:hypothetical protein
MKPQVLIWILALMIVAQARGTAARAAPEASQLPGARRACLHGADETPVEAGRRTEALAAMRMIEDVLSSFPGLRAQGPAWDELARSSGLERRRNMSGPVGDLARKIRWGASEPLPGWGIAYVPGRGSVRYALTDLRDPCGFTYSSEDPDVIPRNRGRLVPLTE